MAKRAAMRGADVTADMVRTESLRGRDGMPARAFAIVESAEGFAVYNSTTGARCTRYERRRVTALEDFAACVVGAYAMPL